MARRSEDWNIGLSKDLRDAAFAREFLPIVYKEFSGCGQSERAPRDQSSPQSNAGDAQSPPEAVQASPESGAADRQAAPDRGVTR